MRSYIQQWSHMSTDSRCSCWPIATWWCRDTEQGISWKQLSQGSLWLHLVPALASLWTLAFIPYGLGMISITWSPRTLPTSPLLWKVYYSLVWLKSLVCCLSNRIHRKCSLRRLCEGISRLRRIWYHPIEDSGLCSCHGRSGVQWLQISRSIYKPRRHFGRIFFSLNIKHIRTTLSKDQLTSRFSHLLFLSVAWLWRWGLLHGSHHTVHSDPLDIHGICMWK